MCIPKTDNHLEILTVEEVKDFVTKNFNETIKKEENLRKVAKSLSVFLTIPDEVQSSSFDNCVHDYNVEILNLIDMEVQLINTKPVIRELKRFKVQTILVLDYNKRNDCKIFHSDAKLIANDSDIDEAFKFMHQIMLIKIGLSWV